MLAAGRVLVCSPEDNRDVFCSQMMKVPETRMPHRHRDHPGKAFLDPISAAGERASCSGVAVDLGSGLRAGWAECRTVRQTAWGQVPAGFCAGPVASPSLFLHCDCRAVPFSQGFSAVGCVREFVVQIAKCYARKINK